MSETEALLVEAMDVIAQRFDKHAVLRGGMVLRVLGCERLTNDYDIWFFLRMGVRPDRPTLEKRLASPAYSRLVRASDHFGGKSADSFFDFLRQAALRLDDRMIEAELGDYLPPEELAGLAMRIRAALAKL